MKFKSMMGLCCALVALSAQAETSSIRTANLAIVKEHIVPRYQQLADAGKAFEQSANQLCTTANQESLDAAQQAFFNVMDAWQSVQHIRKGPVEKDRRYYRFQMWPDKHGTTPKQIANLLNAKDAAALEPTNFAKSSVALQGLEAVETILFARTKGADAYAENGQASYRCQVVKAIGNNITQMAQALVSEWSASPPPFDQVLGSQAILVKGDLAESKEIYAAFYNNLYTQVQAVIDQKLVRPMANNKPMFFESWLSNHSARNIRMNLEAVEAMYDVGFSAALKEQQGGPELDARVKQSFQKFYQALAAIKQPLDDALAANQDRVLMEELLASTSVLQSLLTAAVPKALNIQISFNALDGD